MRVEKILITSSPARLDSNSIGTRAQWSSARPIQRKGLASAETGCAAISDVGFFRKYERETIHP